MHLGIKFEKHSYSVTTLTKKEIMLLYILSATFYKIKKAVNSCVIVLCEWLLTAVVCNYQNKNNQKIRLP